MNELHNFTLLFLAMLLISTLMLNSALHIKDAIALIRESALRTKIVVGGAPFRVDSELYSEIGADAMAKDASEAVGIIARLQKELS